MPLEEKLEVRKLYAKVYGKRPIEKKGVFRPKRIHKLIIQPLDEELKNLLPNQVDVEVSPDEYRNAKVYIEIQIYSPNGKNWYFSEKKALAAMK
ncbi:hypothetical protein HQ533_03810 [Candidatus Woesearchaeota archaeon]|nr:hypothetical protein [Candidatus Woesearchaeota archaeon]